MTVEDAICIYLSFQDVNAFDLGKDRMRALEEAHRVINAAAQAGAASHTNEVGSVEEGGLG